jgi:hypothetical protein
MYKQLPRFCRQKNGSRRPFDVICFDHCRMTGSSGKLLRPHSTRVNTKSVEKPGRAELELRRSRRGFIGPDGKIRAYAG